MPQSLPQINQSSDSIRTALDSLRENVRNILAAQFGGSNFRGIDIVNQFHIDLKLAWKIIRISKANDPFECVRYLPGLGGWDIFCDAAKQIGIGTELADRTRQSFIQVKELGLAWGGDARGFELLAAGLARVSDPRVGLEHRKNHFSSGSYVWGIRAKSLIRLDVIHPAPDGRNIEMATVRGFVDVERLRADAPWYLEVPFCVDDLASGPMDVRFEPIDLADRGRGAPFLLKRLCSDGVPTFEAPKRERVPRVVELPIGSVGVECGFTLFHGAVCRGTIPMHRTPENEFASLMMKIQTPCERIVFDVLLHKDLIIGDVLPTGSMFSVLDGWRGQFSHQNRDRIPIDYEIKEVKSGKRAVGYEGFGRMEELHDSTLARGGWDRKVFRHFRAEIAYPPVPSTMTIDIPLLG